MLDARYILARDNYTCQGCSKAIFLGYGFYNIDKSRGNVTSNIVAICNECVLNKKDIKPTPQPLGFSGRLIVVTGPMFASKSTVTRSIYNKYRVFNSKCIWVKPTTDDRSEGVTETHNEEKFDAVTISAERPDQSLEMLLDYDVIAIDEAQFFSDRLLYVVHRLLGAGKLLIVNGLKLTAQRSLFGIIHYLMAEADDIICLKAVCSKCKVIDTASRTKSYEKLPTVQTGGADAYYAICPVCDGALHESIGS